MVAVNKLPGDCKTKLLVGQKVENLERHCGIAKFKDADLGYYMG